MNRSITLKKDERRIIPVIWTGKEAEIDYSIKLTEEGADITLLMLLFGKENQRLTLKTNVVHASPNTKSRIIIKGALTDSSHVDYEGLSRIDKAGKNSDTWLGAYLLLLSDSATGRAVPKLEILNNEVKAGHAATVGKISEPELFYLMSRGLTKKASTRLIVGGYFESILREFPLDIAKKARNELKRTFSI